jgi:hypothetical protein
MTVELPAFVNSFEKYLFRIFNIRYCTYIVANADNEKHLVRVRDGVRMRVDIEHVMFVFDREQYILEGYLSIFYELFVFSLTPLDALVEEQGGSSHVFIVVHAQVNVNTVYVLLGGALRFPTLLFAIQKYTHKLVQLSLHRV